MAALEDKRNALSQEKTEKESSLALLEENLVQNNQKLNRLEAELLAFSDDPDQMIELLRERFVALLQEEADVSNQLTRIENELENIRQLSQKQADQLEKLKEQLATAKEKASQQKADLETAKEQFKNYWLTIKLLPRSKRSRNLPIKLNKVNYLTVWIISKTSRPELRVWKIF